MGRWGILVTLFVAPLSAAPAAFAQTLDRVDLYADELGLGCSLAVLPQTFVSIHMVHVGPADATGLAFYAPTPACFTDAVWVGDVWAGTFARFATTHDPSGFELAYGECFSLPLYLGYMLFWVPVASEPCCQYRALASPNFNYAGKITAVGCEFHERPGEPFGKAVIISPNASCECNQPVVLEKTTWGRVKSLYR